jgi:protoporphyrinogen oxidase
MRESRKTVKAPRKGLMISSRRIFIKKSFLGAAGVGFAVPFMMNLMAKSKIAEVLMEQAFSDPFDSKARDLAADPIAMLSALNQGNFSGDQPAKAHRILWNKDSYLKSKGGIPAPTESASVVIVGGGISGLSSAYSLRDLKPILLEQADQFGGNSKGEQWDGVNYTIGAAYIGTPDSDSTPSLLLKDLGLLDKFRAEKGEDDTAIVKGQLQTSFWSGASDPDHPEQFRAVFARLRDILDNQYPVIPPTPNSRVHRAELNEWDKISLNEWTAKEFGELHPHIAEIFEEYCWSAFGGSGDELSAAQALSFICADLASVSSLPGGNAMIAQTLYDQLKAQLPASNLRPGSLVIDITPTKTGVNICYESREGVLQTIAAQACVCTSAKFISQVLISAMPDEQRDAMQTMNYRAYVVANVVLKGPEASPAQDLYVLRGEKPLDPKTGLQDRVFTDVTFATWALGATKSGPKSGKDDAHVSVLSLFKPYPYDGARQELYKPSAFEEVKAQFSTELPHLLTSLGVSPDAVAAVRLTRWGHALPLAQKGLIANGTLELASRPIAGRIFLGQQDNWANPCFETAVTCALEASEQARNVVHG